MTRYRVVVRNRNGSLSEVAADNVDKETAIRWEQRYSVGVNEFISIEEMPGRCDHHERAMISIGRCVIIIGENEPRSADWAELFEDEGWPADGHGRWRLVWGWDGDSYTHSRALFDLEIVVSGVVLGRHPHCEGPIGAIATS